MAGLDTNTNLLIPFNGQDGGKEIVDSGSTGHIVTQNGTAILSTAQKKFGSTSVLFDGNSDYLSIPNSPDWDIGGSSVDDWTLDVWVKFTNPAGTQGIADQHESDSQFWYFYHGASGFSFHLYAGGSILSLSGSGLIEDTDWHHVAICKVADEWGMYVDGVQTAYTQDSSTDTWTASLRIGLARDIANYYFNGHMDDFRFQHSNVFGAAPNNTPNDTITMPTSAVTADTDTHLLLHMDTQDTSGDGGSDSYHIPTFVATSQIENGGKFNGGLSLNGTTQYVTVPDHADWDFGTGDFTIEFFAYFNVVSADMRIFELGAYNSGGIGCYYDDTNKDFELYITDGTPRLFSWTASIDTWYHIAISKSSGD